MNTEAMASTRLNNLYYLSAEKQEMIQLRRKIFTIHVKPLNVYVKNEKVSEEMKKAHATSQQKTKEVKK
ncbi:hypothetical protein HZB03_04910 [Candidatus Woesearchaeota archaeon]|nr:hypothetical protein [Candidatus Woesearchaeota archaeon]